MSPLISESCLANGSISQSRGKCLKGCSALKTFEDVGCENGILVSKVEEDAEEVNDDLCLDGPLPPCAYPNISSKSEGN